ncbi:hypothetical protein [Kitasatospora viridis]|uniref:Uncharacterized protein n=1 Tax=Kitasatospora viridis TaxID=281105 RepID=A0A561UPM8_9ACTN|nr:hypothetical protein [Kitasatospora viridis]TWG01327.1 hypothetical protein FHX73_115219 [Kitasatospora viridis]
MSTRFPLPASILLLRARGEWRHSTVDIKGGRTCGGLGGLPADAGPERARAAAEAMLAGLGEEFFGGPLTVDWAPGGLTGEVTPAQR